MTKSFELQIDEIRAWLGSGSINIFGLPFSGKDTHGSELARFFGAPMFGGGDILRSDVSPQHVKDIIATGELAPTNDYLAIVLPYLSQDIFVDKPLILSSLGRWYGEEKAVMEAADASGHPMKAVLYLDITAEEAYRRWQSAERGRLDDAAEHILEKRFDEFKIKTLPVIEFYRKKNLLIDVDGMPPKDEVTKTIIQKLHAMIS
jgi:adenylate kinase